MRLRYATSCFWMILLGSIILADPALAQTRLGLHVTQEELNVWRQRAQSGPYRVVGDASPNSPGDWTRIVNNRNSFASNPSNGRWMPPQTQSGCVVPEQATYAWPEPGTGVTTWSMLLRDAAFHNLVTGVTTNHAAIKTELLWVSSQSFTRWGDPSGIWCFDRLYDIAPSFGIVNILLRLLFAYDYIGRAAFTSGELDQLDRWFFDAADFWRRDMDQGINGVFVDRWNGDYTRTDVCGDPITPFVGGTPIQSYAKFYNNRRGSMIRFSTLAGIYLSQAGRNYTNGRYGTQAQLLESGKMFVRETIRFSLFPGGYVGDFERVEDGTDVGWSYSGSTISNIAAIADAFARVGDSSLFTYNTALGECGTSGTINDGGSRNGQNRDLAFAVQSFMKYPTDVYARYNGFNDSPTDANRIDGRQPRDGSSEHRIHETHLAIANLYLRDPFVRQAYTRTHANSVSYPSSPIGGPPPWMGGGAVYPGILFMFGQMEDNAANPFLSGGGSGGTGLSGATGLSGKVVVQ